MEDCFIICPLGGAHSEIRKKSDKILRHVFQPVLDKNDFKAIRADQIPKVGLITTQIINLIMESPLVIADLTDSNPNVFYELAIRHAIRTFENPWGFSIWCVLEKLSAKSRNYS